jgi:hypothetical protein
MLGPSVDKNWLEKQQENYFLNHHILFGEKYGAKAGFFPSYYSLNNPNIRYILSTETSKQISVCNTLINITSLKFSILILLNKWAFEFALIQINIPDDENELFKYDLQRQFVVFCGTEVMQAKAQTGNHCKAVVIRTG